MTPDIGSASLASMSKRRNRSKNGDRSNGGNGGGKPPVPTIGAARQAIQAARHKMDLGLPRQAAEDAWLGAVTAARTVLYKQGYRKWESTRGVMPRFEAYLKARKRDTRLAGDLYFLAGSLHGSCFYAGVPEACDKKAVEGGIRAAEAFIKDVAPHAAVHRKP